MNKKTLFFIILLIALLVGAIKYNNTIQKPILDFSNSLKSSYTRTLQNIKDKINQHFFQAKHIKELENRLQRCKNENLILKKYKSDLINLYKINNAKFYDNASVELTKAVSYEKFGDTNRVWMDIKDYNGSKIYGLVYKNYVAGIVINKNNNPLGLLNIDQQCTYAVSIGKQKAPGIAHGNNDKNIIVTYIPSWYHIKQGDEVLTSGLDNIFFQNIKVGKVLSIRNSQGYQQAVVKPYYLSNELNYFYLIKQVR